MSEIIFKTGDCRVLMKELEDCSIDMVFTDPPYNISSNTKIILKNHPKQKRKKDRLLTYDFGSWDHFTSKEEFLDFTEQWMKECYRVLKPTGNFVSFFDNFQIGYMKDIWISLGGHPRQPIYWKKKNPKPRLRKVDFRIAIESMFWGCKEDKGHFFNWKLGQQNNIVECAVFLNTERTGHPTQKPTPVLIPWIKYLCPENGIVLDPFVGSGSTLVACQKLNRNAIGYDIDPNMKAINEDRLKLDMKNIEEYKKYKKRERE